MNGASGANGTNGAKGHETQADELEYRVVYQRRDGGLVVGTLDDLAADWRAGAVDASASVSVDGERRTAAEVLDEYAERAAERELGETREEARRRANDGKAALIGAAFVALFFLTPAVMAPEAIVGALLAGIPTFLVGAIGVVLAGSERDWERRRDEAKARFLRQDKQEDKKENGAWLDISKPALSSKSTLPTSTSSLPEASRALTRR